MARKSGKTGKLSKQAILDAAVRLADDSGVDSLSMRKLASALGVEAMSLYNHFANKEELLMVMADWAVGQIALPDASVPWQEAMRARAANARAVYLRHPWVPMLHMSLPNTGFNSLNYVEATLNVLVNGGFDLITADHAWHLFDSYIYGFTMQELNFPFEPDDYSKAAAENLHLIPQDIFPNLRGLAELVAAGAYDGRHEFEFGVEMIVMRLEGICPA